MMQPIPGEPTLGQLFSELAHETSTLVRHEVRLVQTEMTKKVEHAAKDAAMAGVGGVVVHVGVLALVAGVILLLGHVMPLWLSAILVGVVSAIAGYTLTRRSVAALKQLDPAPRETLQTLKENKLWLEQQMR